MKNQAEIITKKMKWSSLKITMLPIIAIEVQYAIQLLNDYYYKILNNHAIKQDLITFNQLFQSIQRQITLLDSFYKNNQYDSTISLFHMLKIKLKKSVFNKKKVSQNLKDKQLTLQKQNHSFSSSNWKHNDSFFLQDKPLFQNKQKQNIKEKQFRNNKHQDSFDDLNNNYKQLSQIQIRKKSTSPLQINNQKVAVIQKKGILNKQKHSSFKKNNSINPSFDKSATNINKNQQQGVNQKKYTKQSKQISKKSTLKEVKPQISKKIQIKSKIQQVNKKQKILTEPLDKIVKKQTYGKINKDSSIKFKKYKGHKIAVQQKGNDEQIKKFKTQNQGINNQKQEEDNQFRFTIKMNRQQYQELLNMKKQLPK